MPRTVEIITLGGAKGLSTQRARIDGDRVRVTDVDRGDVAGVVSALCDALSVEADGPAWVWIDAVTPLLEAVGFDRVFRLLYFLADQMQTATARAWYRLNPAAHANETITALQYLLDCTVKPD